jgi:hypothetical protein
VLHYTNNNAIYSNLSRRRYAQNDDTLYVAPEDIRTDYVRLDENRDDLVLIYLSISRSRQWRIGTGAF